jgi:uncharacterized protein YbjT (DUF2867 family)
MRVFITGGSSELGALVARKLVEQGHDVTVASRSARAKRGIEAVEVDLSTGLGLDEVAGHDTVVHLASNPFAARQVDVEGTRRLVDAATEAGVGHLLAISIVGVDDHPQPNYQAKVEMEQIIANGAIPWTILRSTQFHSFIPRFIDMLPSIGMVPAPNGVNLQPIDIDVVAERLVELVEAGPSGRVADLGGPDVIPMRRLLKDVLRARRQRRLVVPVPLPRRLGTALRDGRMTTSPTNRGERWDEFVERLQPARDLVGRLSMLTAFVLLVTAAWMAVSPSTFHSVVAPFGEHNDHLFRDIAAYTLPLVIGLWIAADRHSWRVPVFAIALVQNGAHAINHLVDLTATDPIAIGVGTFVSLVATETLLAWMLARTLRERSTPAPQPVPAEVLR